MSVNIRMNDTDYFIHRWLAMLPSVSTSRENGTGSWLLAQPSLGLHITDSDTQNTSENVYFV